MDTREPIKKRSDRASVGNVLPTESGKVPQTCPKISHGSQYSGADQEPYDPRKTEVEEHSYSRKQKHRGVGWHFDVIDYVEHLAGFQNSTQSIAD
jgi:hypothetical protein